MGGYSECGHVVCETLKSAEWVDDFFYADSDAIKLLVNASLLQFFLLKPWQ